MTVAEPVLLMAFLRIDGKASRMRVLVTYVVLLVWMTGCATPTQRLQARVTENARRANLQRAVSLPWRDDGRCVVEEASHPWPVVAERCFHALDTQKVRFRDLHRRCPVASADAATLQATVGVCLLAQPELLVGVVVVVGVFVVAVAIVEALDAYERQGQREVTKPKRAKPASVEMTPSPEPTPEPGPKPGPFPLGPSVTPPNPDDPERPECKPVPVPHRGGNGAHNLCADQVPLNAFPGFEALVNGKQFDAVQLATRVLWEVKTDNFDTYAPYVQKIAADKEAKEMGREKALAAACGYSFRVGVKSAAHMKALLDVDKSLDIVIMDWC